MTNPPRPGDVPPRPQPAARPRTQPPGTPRVQPPATPPRPADLSTRLDGQRGWLNELDRSLKKRSLIALILTCLAVGVGAAAMYIAITKNSDSDRINALETRIEAIEAVSGATTGVVPETGVTLPETGTTLPETGTTLPDTGSTLPETGTTTVVPPAE
ncbi:MAG: hypothetical protein ACSLFI_12395 [Solirubrobacterales bacterium]